MAISPGTPVPDTPTSPAPHSCAPTSTAVPSPSAVEGTVRLRGELRCADTAEARTVTRHLPSHLTLTRAEPGCLTFRVTPTADPLVWEVAEEFRDAAAFGDHQRRVAASAWGRATAGIAREYTIEGLPEAD